jgi:hypothetical protein
MKQIFSIISFVSLALLALNSKAVTLADVRSVKDTSAEQLNSLPGNIGDQKNYGEICKSGRLPKEFRCSFRSPGSNTILTFSATKLRYENQT